MNKSAPMRYNSLMECADIRTNQIFNISMEMISMDTLDKISRALLIIGGLNWGLVGIFEFDLVAWLFGGSAAVLSRIVYTLVSLAAIWSIAKLFRTDQPVLGTEH